MRRDDACVLDMLIAARKISPEIASHQIIGMRNRMVHEYFRVIPAKVWDVVEQEIPPLIALREPLVPPAGREPPGASQ